MKWKILTSETVLKDQWIHVRSDKCEMKNGKIIQPFYILEYPDFVNAVALTVHQKVILNKQYRHGTGQIRLELPSGTVDENEDPETTIRRELLEETGYEFGEIILTAKVSPNTANHSNYAYSFLALDGVLKPGQMIDDDEIIENVLVSLEAFEEMLDNNEFDNAMHVASAHYGLKKIKKLNGI